MNTTTYLGGYNPAYGNDFVKQAKEIAIPARNAIFRQTWQLLHYQLVRKNRVTQSESFNNTIFGDIYAVFKYNIKSPSKDPYDYDDKNALGLNQFFNNQDPRQSYIGDPKDGIYHDRSEIWSADFFAPPIAIGGYSYFIKTPFDPNMPASTQYELYQLPQPKINGVDILAVAPEDELKWNKNYALLKSVRKIRNTNHDHWPSAGLPVNAYTIEIFFDIYDKSGKHLRSVSTGEVIPGKISELDSGDGVTPKYDFIFDAKSTKFYKAKIVAGRFSGVEDEFIVLYGYENLYNLKTEPVFDENFILIKEKKNLNATVYEPKYSAFYYLGIKTGRVIMSALSEAWRENQNIFGTIAPSFTSEDHLPVGGWFWWGENWQKNYWVYIYEKNDLGWVGFVGAVVAVVAAYFGGAYAYQLAIKAQLTATTATLIGISTGLGIFGATVSLAGAISGKGALSSIGKIASIGSSVVGVMGGVATINNIFTMAASAQGVGAGAANITINGAAEASSAGGFTAAKNVFMGAFKISSSVVNLAGAFRERQVTSDQNIPKNEPSDPNMIHFAANNNLIKQKNSEDEYIDIGLDEGSLLYLKPYLQRVAEQNTK